MSTNDTVLRLSKVLSSYVGFISGTLALPPRDFILYYGKEELGRIDLANASPDELDELEKACQPATFGVNAQDVLDESYRKAGKLDVDSFMVGFSAKESGLLEVVRTGLFPDTGHKKELDAELYKLNVYGKDAHFKSHKDTPRAENMFGSLVVVFPTPHEGGTLDVRYVLSNGSERHRTLNSGELLSKPDLPPRIAFAAFFSDDDHEVTRVTAGHRVTVTYNLYFRTPSLIANPLAEALQTRRPLDQNTSKLQHILAKLLEDRSFLPNGGTLGFGLRHQYPLPKTASGGDPNPLFGLERWLKGADAALFRALSALGLHPGLRLLYQNDDDRGTELIESVLLDNIPNEDLDAQDGPIPWQMISVRGGIRMYRVDLFGTPRMLQIKQEAARKHGRPEPHYITEAEEAEVMESSPGCYLIGGRPYLNFTRTTVHMVTDVNPWKNKIKSPFMAYGNQAAIGLMYTSLCLVVDVGPTGKRGVVNPAKWKVGEERSPLGSSSRPFGCASIYHTEVMARPAAGRL